jgi:hypothetical protein
MTPGLRERIVARLLKVVRRAPATPPVDLWELG